MKKKNDCQCEADMQKEIKGLVDEVKGYTKEDHDKKQAEIKAAFEKKDKKK